jgi:hypothetical protein
MALTAQNKADIRTYLGWSARFHQTDSRLEQAMSALETEPEHEKWITNTLAPVAGEPRGILAELVAIDAKLDDAHNRLKALKVGSIDLPIRNEINTLRSEGRRHVSRMATILGVEVRHDVYSGAPNRNRAAYGGLANGGNYDLHG